MKNKSVDTAYTAAEASEYDEIRFTSTGGIATHAVEMGHVSRFLAKYRRDATQTVIEVGCGTGRLLADLDTHKNVTGLDLSQHMLDEADQTLRAFDGPSLVCGNAADMSMFEDNSFDLAYSVRLLNRVGTKEVAAAVVSEIARITKTDGFALIEMTNEQRPHRGKGTVAFSVADFRRVVEESGLEVIDVQGAFVLGVGPWTNRGPSFLKIAKLFDALFLRFSPAFGARVYYTTRVK